MHQIEVSNIDCSRTRRGVVPIFIYIFWQHTYSVLAKTINLCILQVVCVYGEHRLLKSISCRVCLAPMDGAELCKWARDLCASLAFSFYL